MKRVYITAETKARIDALMRPGETQSDLINRLLNVYYILDAERKNLKVEEL